MKKNILFISSPGGHEIQAGLVLQGLSQDSRVSCDLLVCNGKLNTKYNVQFPDFNVNSATVLLPSIIRGFKFLKENRPDLLISTGAAPGVAFIVAAKLLGIKTIWIDSIANTKKLSLSGRLVKPFVSKFFTQWPELAKGNARYIGALL